MDGPDLDRGHVADLCSAALDVLARPVVICDRQKVLFANAAAARAMRAESASELIGLSIDEMLHPDLHTTGAMRRQLVLDSRQSLSELPVKLVGRDGSIICVLADARPIEFDGDAAIVFTYGPTCPMENRS